MIIYFLTLAYPTEEAQSNLYSDLMNELALRRHKVSIFTANEIGAQKHHISNGIVSVETVRTGEITKKHFLLKTINTLLISRRYIRRLRKVVTSGIMPDLLIYSTPPITFYGAVRYLKKKTGCRTYLLLKDIFPANACDLGMIKRGSLIWRFFRRKERNLYNISDRIGCMSKANVDYLLTHNPSLPSNKVEVCYNSILPTPPEQIPVVSKEVFKKYNIPVKPFTMIYGGNLGSPQGVPFIINVIEAIRNDSSVQFVIVGDGTHFGMLKKYREQSCNDSLILLNKIPKSDYLALLCCMDAGLIFLDERFSIPNYPSRMLDYLDYSLPILAATDITTDVRALLEDNACGLWSQSGDVKAFITNVEKLKKDPIERKAMGKRGRAVLESRFSVAKSADVILSAYQKMIL